jgi:hypothetical protein
MRFVPVAMTASSSSWRRCKTWTGGQRQRASEISNSILSSSDWGSLNFGEIEKSLASKLTDDDMYAILACIDAGSNLKRLSLAGCINITGKGLEPLSGSIVLEQIDLSLVALHENPFMPKSLISETAVLPILDSIVGAVGSSLRHLQLPKKFCERKTRKMICFLERYDELLKSCNRTCSIAQCGANFNDA